MLANKFHGWGLGRECVGGWGVRGNGGEYVSWVGVGGTVANKYVYVYVCVCVCV